MTLESATGDDAEDIAIATALRAALETLSQASPSGTATDEPPALPRPEPEPDRRAPRPSRSPNRRAPPRPSRSPNRRAPRPSRSPNRRAPPRPSRSLNRRAPRPSRSPNRRAPPRPSRSPNRRAPRPSRSPRPSRRKLGRARRPPDKASEPKSAAAAAAAPSDAAAPSAAQGLKAGRAPGRIRAAANGRAHGRDHEPSGRTRSAPPNPPRGRASRASCTKRSARLRSSRASSRALLPPVVARWRKVRVGGAARERAADGRAAAAARRAGGCRGRTAASSGGVRGRHRRRDRPDPRAARRARLQALALAVSASLSSARSEANAKAGELDSRAKALARERTTLIDALSTRGWRDTTEIVPFIEQSDAEQEAEAERGQSLMDLIDRERDHDGAPVTGGRGGGSSGALASPSLSSDLDATSQGPSGLASMLPQLSIGDDAATDDSAGSAGLGGVQFDTYVLSSSADLHFNMPQLDDVGDVDDEAEGLRSLSAIRRGRRGPEAWEHFRRSTTWMNWRLRLKSMPADAGVRTFATRRSRARRALARDELRVVQTAPLPSLTSTTQVESQSEPTILGGTGGGRTDRRQRRERDRYEYLRRRRREQQLPGSEQQRRRRLPERAATEAAAQTVARGHRRGRAS